MPAARKPKAPGPREPAPTGWTLEEIMYGVLAELKGLRSDLERYGQAVQSRVDGNPLAKIGRTLAERWGG